ncbi:MAG TPA: hypothetical protein DGG94_02935 [Micromonosporaceae bacterium]|nr:hypothetical protein [Micromonosporaceae bacterium]HCU48773.1 hypothetical protein [Micromonosporaceae bacterium]
MASRLAALMAKFHTKPRPSLPAWATEDTVEIEALAKANRQIEWATESTGLLNVLRAGLESLDDAPDRPFGL